MGVVTRFAFEPLLDLTGGRPVGLEVTRCLDRDRTELVATRVVWGLRQLAEFDTGIAVASLLSSPTYDATVPVHVGVTADAVVAAHPRLLSLPGMLRERMGLRPSPLVVLDIGPALTGACDDALIDGVAKMRAAGLLISVERAGRGFGLDLLAELAPDLLKIDVRLVRRLSTDPRARVVVSALRAVADSIGGRLAAVGVTHREELAALRDLGVDFGQGPLLAPLRPRPSTTGALLPVELMPRAQSVRGRHVAPVRPAPPLTVAALVQPAVLLPHDVTAEQVRAAFAAHAQADSIVLVDGGRRPTGFLDRNRFMIAVSGPFGHALYARRPAASLADPPRALAVNTQIGAALEFCITDRARSWEDLVLLDGSLSCAGVVHPADLLRAATGLDVFSVA